MGMHLRLLLHDFRKKAWKNSILFVFMCLAVTTATVVVLMLTQLFSSITKMYETAKPPHFLQMHMGDVKQADIDAFNNEFSGVVHSQTVPMMDFYGDSIWVKGKNTSYTLSDCRLDIGFVKQNTEYDVLLDANRKPLKMEEGEIAVPVIVLSQYDISIGDEITIQSAGIEKTFTVTSYAYDGMMNSTMCSSTRFLISDADFDALFGTVGETEYLIETYFEDSATAGAYQTAYEQSSKNLPKNGQAITYKAIFLLSALTDIMTAMIYVLAGILLTVIVIMCLRFVILAELEDDMDEIGTMKSIGIPENGIRNLYLNKIRILLGASGVVGFFAALCLYSKATGHITRFFGEQPLSKKGCMWAVLAVLLLYALIILFAKRTLRKIKTKTIVDLLVLNNGFGKKTKLNKRGMFQAKHLSVNALVGTHELRNGYGIVFRLLLAVTFLIMVPIRSLQTMQDKEFITYMGSPVCDLLAEVVQGESLEERNTSLLSYLEKEEAQGNIQSADVLRRVRLQVFCKEQEPVGVHIDVGSNAGKGIRYVSGTNPTQTNHIALSVLLADELGTEVGDTVTIASDSKNYSFTLCGIYQDVTSGGKTAKAICDFAGETAEKYTYQISLSKEEAAEAFAKDLRESLGAGYSIENMDGFLEQTLGGVTQRVSQAVFLVLLVGAVITAFIILLFMELRLARTMPALAQKTAMGIPFRAICMQELYPVLIFSGAGAFIGFVLTELVGDKLLSALFSLLGLGISKISFAPLTLGSVLILPALAGILIGIHQIVCRKIRKTDISRYFNQ